MARVNLTLARIRDAKTDKRQELLSDAQVPGLVLRVLKNGTKTFIFRAKFDGKSLWITIGSADAWTLEDARIEARRLRMLIDQGLDPLEVQRQEQAAREAQRRKDAAGAISFGDAFGRYIEERKVWWGQKHLREHLAMLDGPLNLFADMPLAGIDQKVVMLWLEAGSRQRPAYTALAFRIARAFFNWAHERGYTVDLSAFTAKRVKELLPPVRPRKDSLQREQLPAWFEAVGRIPNRTCSAYLQALLLTGARRNELAAIKWTDVDLSWDSITLRDKGTTRGEIIGKRTIPLTRYVKSLFLSLPRVNEYVFAASTGSGYIVEPRISHNKALQAAGLNHVSIHGLRRSFSQLSEWKEMPAGILAQIMGHAPSAVAEKHYKDRPLDLLRIWHSKLESWILEQAGVATPTPEQLSHLHAVK